MMRKKMLSVYPCKDVMSVSIDKMSICIELYKLYIYIYITQVPCLSMFVKETPPYYTARLAAGSHHFHLHPTGLSLTEKEQIEQSSLIGALATSWALQKNPQNHPLVTMEL